MKNRTEYRRKIKRLATRLKRDYGTPEPPKFVDPIDQLLIGILHRGTTVSRAERALARLRSTVVDLNELRVSDPRSEILESLGPNFAHAMEKAVAITLALNGVFDRYHEISLDALRCKPKKAKVEARRFLEGLDGVDPATAAGVTLFALEGHAVPVDENTLRVLREDGLIDPDIDVEEVQGFLERTVGEGKSYEFTMLLRRYAEDRIKKLGPAKPPAKKKAARQARPTKTRKKAASSLRKTASSGKKAATRSARKTTKTKRKTAKTKKKTARTKRKAATKRTRPTRRSASSSAAGRKRGKTTKSRAKRARAS